MTIPSHKKSRPSAEIVAEQATRHFEIAKFIGIAAMKVRAGMMEPGKVVRLDNLEFVVDEDELDEWVVVNITRPKAEVEEMGITIAADLGIDLEFKSSRERLEWKEEFVAGLKMYLEKWNGIKCIQGPGEELVFEKAVYKRQFRDWR
jgi:hypothetical protein